MNKVTSFGRWMMGRRQALDMTRDDLADVVGCAPITIAKIERGERRPSRQMAELLADVLRLTAEERVSFVRWARGVVDTDAEPGRAENAMEKPTGEDEAARSAAIHLPASATSFIGRDEDVAKLRALLWRADVRLVTLTGSPGIGKTRLALAVAARMGDDFADGVRFVPLAPVSDPALVADTVARALGLKDVSGQTVEESLKAYLQDKQMLLLVDNFEHVLSAATLLSGLLASAPRLKLLVTSREVLRLYGEHESRVPPLGVPRSKFQVLSAPSPEQHEDWNSELGTSPAVELFVQRAQAVKPDFALANENAAQVAEICRELDGLPLAIELAAARIKLLNPEAILVRLVEREPNKGARKLRVLTGGPRDLPERHQTLHNAIDWSYGLLSDGEKRLFRRLCVFRGGRSMEEVAAVCLPGDEPDDEKQARVLEMLEALMDKSLLQSRPGSEGETRFWMLETIFSYAAERLEESGEEDEFRVRHARYYVDFAKEVGARIVTPEQPLWAARTDQEIDNVRTAQQWLLDHDEVELALQMAAGLARYWIVRGYFTEGRRWLEAPLARSEGSQAALRHKVLYFLAALLLIQDESSQAIPYVEEALSLSRQIGDKQTIANSLNALGMSRQMNGDYEQALICMSEAVALLRELWQEQHIPGQISNTAIILSNMAFVNLYLEAYERSLELCMESFEAHRGAPEDITNRAITEINLGLVYLHMGDLERGGAQEEKALELGKQVGDKRTIGLTLTYLGLVECLRGNFDGAGRLYQESLEKFAEIGHRFGVARNLAGLARVALDRGRFEAAAWMCSFAESYYPLLLINLLPLEKSLHTEVVEGARRAMGQEAYEVAMQKGRSMSLHDALALLH